MKRLFRSFLIETGVLYLVWQATTGLSFDNGFTSIFIAGVFLTVASFFVRPVVNILLLPLNLITFGLFKWMANAVVLYLVDFVLPEFRVGAFNFVGYSNDWFSLPAFQTGSIFVSYIAFSFVIFLLSGILYWLIK